MKDGMARAANKPMIKTTSIISTKVNPDLDFLFRLLSELTASFFITVAFPDTFIPQSLN
jgi:hypothetical protein